MIEFRHDLQNYSLIRGVDSDTGLLIRAKVQQFLLERPRLFLPELKAQLSSRLWVINTKRPERLIAPAGVMAFDRCEGDRIGDHAVLTLVKASAVGDRRLRVELCTRQWPSRELIDVHQQGPHAAIAVDVSWVYGGTPPGEMSEALESGIHCRFVSLNSPYGPPRQIVRWLHNPLHDAAQAEIDGAYQQACEQHRSHGGPKV